jgi:Raf kinase inhibitor-like YbhB/YbcL family protein
MLIAAEMRDQGGSAVEEVDFVLESKSFSHGEPIGRDFTCDGSDVSPHLQWTGTPPGTQSYVLICDDPDAPVGTWVHWVYFNIPPTVAELPEAFAPDEHPELGGAQGANDFRRIGYGGPCPPSGTHRYFFKLYALDTTLNLAAGSTKRQVLRAAEGHVLAQAELMGTYSR